MRRNQLQEHNTVVFNCVTSVFVLSIQRNVGIAGMFAEKLVDTGSHEKLQRLTQSSLFSTRYFWSLLHVLQVPM